VKIQTRYCAAAVVFCLAPALCQTNPGQVEPNAGNWKTWVISSGKDYRVPPPPDAAATQSELSWLKDYSAQQSNPDIALQIRRWDAGAPAYRWIDWLNDRVLAEQPLGLSPRAYAYVSIAMHDATVAAWESKYFYNRSRPSEVDPSIKTAVSVPRSPSYPSEHAAAAAAAATVLAYILPGEAQSLLALAEEAGRSRLLAGVQYPSDYTAGMELGRRIGEQVVARARADGSDAVWTGTVPTGPCNWVGTNPGNVTAVNWKPFLLASANEFRPPVPPACTSAQVQAETEAVRTFPRTFQTNYKSFYWQSPDGLQVWPYRLANLWMAEDHAELSPPRVARVYALLSAAMWDTFIASQDGKFAYWYLRPHMLDSRITPLFPVPNFPSYPSNHSSFSAVRSEMLAYLFPQRETLARATGKEAGDSRIWAGIHYEIDNVSGVNLGRAIAQKFIEWANRDGSQ